MINRLRLLALGFASLAAGLTGCVERKITIGSDPSGALVWLNDQEVGHTPVTVPFTTYGDYDVRIRFEKNSGTPDDPKITRYYLHTHKVTKIPPFEYIPLDFFAEILPFKFVDHQIWAFPVPEVVEPAEKDLIDHAKEMKDRLGPAK